MRLPAIQHRSVFITGCSTGIGLATAHRLRAAGWRVIASARKPADVAQLTQAGFEALALDVADEHAVANVCADLLQRLDGCLGALVNNAGFGQPGALEDLSRAVLRHQFEVNVFGLQDLTNRLVPAMLRAGSGRIVHISSVLGRVTLPLLGCYCASKHAVESLADAQRVELRGTGVGLIVVEPGPIDTQFRRTAARQLETALDGSHAEYQSHYAKEIEKRRTATKPNSSFALGPDAVAQVIQHALESRTPRARYAVTLPARLAPLLRKLLPDPLWDAALSQRMPRRNQQR